MTKTNYGLNFNSRTKKTYFLFYDCHVDSEIDEEFANLLKTACRQVEEVIALKARMTVNHFVTTWFTNKGEGCTQTEIERIKEKTFVECYRHKVILEVLPKQS